MHQPFEDGVGQGGFVEIGVPGGHGELTGDCGGLAVVVIIEEFEQVAATLGGERGQARVIENQELGFGVVAQQFGITTVGTGQGQLGEQARQADMAGGITETASLLRQGRRHPGFADPGRAGDEVVEALDQPATAEQVLEQGFVRAARGAAVEVLGAGGGL